MTVSKVELELGGRTLSIETGKWAKQADGAVVVQYGETVVLGTAVHAEPRAGIDFFPLTVDYREKLTAYLQHVKHRQVGVRRGHPVGIADLPNRQYGKAPYDAL